uniref:(northern house mosquito) hypothetical protein n=1 Tax=Culex pipiens TaxID=7175 RepID=A0A8D8E8V4_CULPI
MHAQQRRAAGHLQVYLPGLNIHNAASLKQLTKPSQKPFLPYTRLRSFACDRILDDHSSAEPGHLPTEEATGGKYVPTCGTYFGDFLALHDGQRASKIVSPAVTAG